ncbi:MAG: phosphate ABC transporter permease family protein, partial [Halioglobus sp.]|nr:phosphate ABC transporter permease family protein [Halioglobus sp.]
MQTTTVFLVLIALCAVSFYTGRRRSQILAMQQEGGLASLHSLPNHYGYMAAVWAALPALVVLLLWMGLESSVLHKLVIAQLPQKVQEMPVDELGLYYNQIRGFASGAIDSAQLDTFQVEAAEYYRQTAASFSQLKAAMVFLVAVIGTLLALRRVTPLFRARNHVEKIFEWVLFSCSFIAVLTTLGIVLSVMFEAIRFFQIIPLSDFLFGLQWSPQMAIRANQVAASGSFGFVPLLVGTLLISAVALLIAVPVGLMSAIY